MRQTIPLLAVTALILAAAQVRGQEVAVPQDQVPKAVMNALLAKFPKAAIDICVKATEGGEVIYDIEFKQEGRKFEADIKANGTYLNYEQAIEITALPEAVIAAIEKRYPRSVLKEIMQETEITGKTEQLSAYEVIIDTVGKGQVEVRVSPEGKVLEDTGATMTREKK